MSTLTGSATALVASATRAIKAEYVREENMLRVRIESGVVFKRMVVLASTDVDAGSRERKSRLQMWVFRDGGWGGRRRRIDSKTSKREWLGGIVDPN